MRLTNSVVLPDPAPRLDQQVDVQVAGDRLAGRGVR